MYEVKDILLFIKKFKRYDNQGILEKTFLNGFCYYFSVMLNDRFGGEILYDPINGHFVVLIQTTTGNHLFDITGCVDSSYPNLNILYTKSDWLKSGSIVRGCILKYEE